MSPSPHWVLSVLWSPQLLLNTFKLSSAVLFLISALFLTWSVKKKDYHQGPASLTFTVLKDDWLYFWWSILYLLKLLLLNCKWLWLRVAAKHCTWNVKCWMWPSYTKHRCCFKSVSCFRDYLLYYLYYYLYYYYYLL